MDPELILLLGVLAAFFGGQWFFAHRRNTGFRALATRLGFVYIGGALPNSVTLGGTEIGRYSEVWNVIDGQFNGVRVVAFDCRIGTGKGSWRRTVIAAESEADVFAVANVDPSFTIDQSGAWKIMYEPRKTISSLGTFVSIEALEANIRAIGLPK